ncbi:MAG: hypothetical protein JWM95_5179, partial [Gemmatimonadetes bacterium]|nr:hypothetical protein [Gemmatimonadota bacterium]
RLSSSRVRRVASYTKGHQKPPAAVHHRRNPCKIAGVGCCSTPAFRFGVILAAFTPRQARTVAIRLAVGACSAALLAAAGCREGISGFGTGLRARTSADQLFGAMADRHVEIVRNGKYDYARVQLSRGALSPSRVFDDTAAWTAASGAVRILETFGTHMNDKYVMSSHSGVQAPAKPADGRHVTTLSRLSENQYRWDTTVDFGLGSARPADIALIVTRLLTAGEGATEQGARADLLASSPRAAAAFGTLFSLDSLHPTPLADGTTAVTMVVGVHSELLKLKLPAFGEYVHKYVDPARIHFGLADHSGAPFLEALYKDRVLTVHLRSQGGHLVPLTGPARPMPDSLVVTADFSVKVRVFTVGFHELSLDFVNSAKSDREHDWTVTARKEPKWNLPFITARLIRAPLRFPFSGEGALFRLGVRTGDGGPDAQTVLIRQSRLGVQESAILKFVNSLSNTAMDDFGARVEHEENQWLREGFIALREDARAILVP